MANCKSLSAVRAAAGKAGADARWRDVERKPPTVKVRIYSADAARLKAMPGSIADAVRTLLTAHLKI